MNQRQLRQAVKETLNMEGVPPRSVEVSIALIDDPAMRRLNHQYRGKDAPTDVLSFTQDTSCAFPGVPRLLGDVVISVDTAVRQAEAAGLSLADEVSHLAIHGILHLLGYDDATPEGYTTMVQKGRDAWGRLLATHAAASDAQAERHQ